MPGLMFEDIYAAYPEAKYILTERDPDKWVRSWRDTLGQRLLLGRKLPLFLFRVFNSHLNESHLVLERMLDLWTGGRFLTAEGLEHSRQYYID